MCCRFYVDDDAEDRIRSAVRQFDPQRQHVRTGDIHPADLASVISERNRELYVSDMRWGFLQQEKLLINARAESAGRKVTFADSLRERRCVMPAAGFYEWNRSREKVTFTWDGHPLFYLAGFYRRYGDGNHFIVLTREANDSMKPVHDRMPLILDEETIGAWILEDGKTEEILSAPAPQLTGRQPYRQMSLFD